MSKNKIEVLERDDEVLRNNGMTSGTQKCRRWDIRPTCAPEVSYMQDNGIIDGENGLGSVWRNSAFAFIHSAPKSEVLSCVRNRDAFVARVDKWMEENNPKGDDIKALSSLFSGRLEEWFSSSSEVAESGPSSGN